MIDNELQKDNGVARTLIDDLGFPPVKHWAWALLPVPAGICAILTLTLQSIFTHAGFFHLLLVATPVSFGVGLTIGTMLSVYLVRSRWSYLLAFIQLIAITYAYLAVSEPGVELFP